MSQVGVPHILHARGEPNCKTSLERSAVCRAISLSSEFSLTFVTLNFRGVLFSRLPLTRGIYTRELFRYYKGCVQQRKFSSANISRSRVVFFAFFISALYVSVLFSGRSLNEMKFDKLFSLVSALGVFNYLPNRR